MDRSERNKLYYQQHREDIIIKSRERQEEVYSIDYHRDKIRKRQREYYRNNREEILKKAKEVRDLMKD